MLNGIGTSLKGSLLSNLGKFKHQRKTIMSYKTLNKKRKFLNSDIQKQKKGGKALLWKIASQSIQKK